MEEKKNLALLIDADNISAQKMPQIMEKVSGYGNIALKRAYGNWRKEGLKSWEIQLKHYAIKAVQQFDYVAHKNASDIALVIDAMTLLQQGIYDGFIIASNDSDFTPLTIHLHEAGMFVIGIGQACPSEALQRSCDLFFTLEDHYLAKDLPSEIKQVHVVLRKNYDLNKDDHGFAHASSAGSLLKLTIPDFKPQNFGYDSLHDLIAAFPDKYTIYWTGSTHIYRCLEDKDPISSLGGKTKAHQNAILKYLEEHSRATRKELEKLLSLHASRTGEILRGLINQNVITAEGSQQNRVYRRRN